MVGCIRETVEHIDALEFAAEFLFGLCAIAGTDEYGDSPCWGTDELVAFVEDAHSRDIRVLIDVAFNHFGHGYRMYDVAGAMAYDSLVDGQSADVLWDFAGTHDDALVEPWVAGRHRTAVEIDEFELEAVALDVGLFRCGGG